MVLWNRRLGHGTACNADWSQQTIIQIGYLFFASNSVPETGAPSLKGRVSDTKLNSTGAQGKDASRRDDKSFPGVTLNASPEEMRSRRFGGLAWGCQREDIFSWWPWANRSKILRHRAGPEFFSRRG
jgi:hypothetical protein